ncbi:MAG: IS3 family transposase, partial [Candidatus Scalindua sp.]|nr:IS3 family transposase [Candidatus Scalindua sp.]
KVVLELLESGLTLNEVASKHKILPKNLQNWKKQFLSNMSIAFDKKQVAKSYEKDIVKLKRENDQLARTLGKTVIERDWAVEKLQSLDLSSRKLFLTTPEAIQARDTASTPSLTRQLTLLSVSKKAYYYQPVNPFSTPEDLQLLNKIDEIYTEHPYYGYRRMKDALKRDGISIGKKRTATAMRYMGLRAIYPEPKTTVAIKEHQKHPYLLKEFKNKKGQVIVTKRNQVWSTDITYIRMAKGFVYLAAIIDWSTKKILSWKLSNTMDVSLTTAVLEDALRKYPKPDILNTDQGSQYTAQAHIDILVQNKIAISMDGKGRSIDNIVIERFWRSLKYEHVYLNDYTSKKEAERSINEYMNKYNRRRLHSAIGNITPNELYYNDHHKMVA